MRKGFELFAHFYMLLDQTTNITKKTSIVVDYFNEASEEDKIWALTLMLDKRPSRIVTTSVLKTWASEIIDLPNWLFEESIQLIGDVPESIALLLPLPEKSNAKSLKEWVKYIAALRPLIDDKKREKIIEALSVLNAQERYVFNKLLTGGFRMGVDNKTLTIALANFTKRDKAHIAHRLIEKWHPEDVTFNELIYEESELDNLCKPFPFLMTSSLDGEVEELGDINNYFIKHQWNGNRAQIIFREGILFIWSQEGELVTLQYPEFHSLKERNTENFVLDGELLAMKDGQFLPYEELQKRINRKTIGKKLLSDVPIIFVAFDILEYQGKDLRQLPLIRRRELLEELIENINHSSLVLSDMLKPTTWKEAHAIRAKSRSNGTNGLIIKKKTAHYVPEDINSTWYNWNVDPLSINAVLLYATRGQNSRSYTEFTFAVWDDELLVPFTKADANLRETELQEITQFINSNTKERFGPVRSVHAELVFEIAFDGIGFSSRHKSGVVLRNARIVRWRREMIVEEIGLLEELRGMVE